MSRAYSRDIQLHIRYGDIAIAMLAEGVSWSPDAAHDLVARASEAFNMTLASMAEYGLLEVDEDDEDEFGPVPDKELIDPFRVNVEGEHG